jgi:hypothetical protein
MDDVKHIHVENVKIDGRPTIFYSVWGFGLDDYKCVGISTVKEDAVRISVANAYDTRPAPVISHRSIDELIDQLLKARLGKLADSLLKLEKFADTLFIPGQDSDPLIPKAKK